MDGGTEDAESLDFQLPDEDVPIDSVNVPVTANTGPLLPARRGGRRGGRRANHASATYQPVALEAWETSLEAVDDTLDDFAASNNMNDTNDTNFSGALHPLPSTVMPTDWESHNACILEDHQVLQPGGARGSDSDNEDDQLVPHSQLGRHWSMPIEQQVTFLPLPEWQVSMGRLYKVCDDAGAPKLLCDKFMEVMRQETSLRGFDPNSKFICKRRTFFDRARRQLNISKPEEVRLTLESGTQVSVFRFNFKERLQDHLTSVVFSDLKNLTLQSSDMQQRPCNRWQCIPSANTTPPLP